jgi:predicted outer membrane protein
MRRLAALVIVLIAIAIPTAAAAAGPADDLGDGWTMTPTGPLGPADRDFLVKVRQAGLWEGPAGDMAQERSTNARVKEVGHHLHEDHAALDAQVRAAAAKLGVELPDTPSNEQQGWLNEFSTRTGPEFDRVWADRLRAAHGKVFAVIAAVRAGTRNDTVREFAQTANNVVLKHMTLLESTGLVQFDALPTAAIAAPSTSAGRINPSLVWLVLGVAGLAGLAAAARVVRPR